MTKEEIIGIANQASKEWLKEFPTPEETAHPVPKRFLEIFAKLVAEKECEECAKACEVVIFKVKPIYSVVAENCVKAIRARGQK